MATAVFRKKQYQTKTEVIGPGKQQKKQITILNRVITYGASGVELEADPRHAELIVKQLKLEEAKGCLNPGQIGNDKDEDDERLSPEQSTLFRAVAARANYLSQDRYDIQYSTKEICRSMATPTQGAWRKLKELGRYLISKPRCVWVFKWANYTGNIRVYTDANWAGCTKTRRSTSAGVLMLGQHVIKTWSRTQQTVALSSAEAELYAAGRGGQEAKGLQQLLRELEVNSNINVYIDAKAALGIIQRDGLGRTRHIDTQWLWLQRVREMGYIKFDKIWGSMNPADVGTKYLTHEKLNNHLSTLNVEFTTGRAKSAPQVVTD